MSSILRVRDGATGTVSTGGMLVAAGLLRVLATRAAAGRDRLAGVLSPDATVLSVFAGGAVVDAGLEDLRAQLATTAAAAESLAAGLMAAATAYAEAEELARRRVEAVGGVTAYVLGIELLASVAVTPLGPWLPFLHLFPETQGGAPLPSTVGDPRSPERQRPRLPAPPPGFFTRAGRWVVGDEHVIDLTRVAVSSTDEAAAGATAIPLFLSEILEARGRRGVEPSARRVPDFLPGALHETGVTVHRIPASAGAAAAPKTFAQVAERIPAARPGEPQVRIERYTGRDGKPQWVVYVGGTIDAGLRAGDDAWDMTSNIAAVGDGDGGSIRAVVTAMKAEGIGADDPVTIAGHSQGGIVATRVAQRDDVHVTTLITYGSPVGQMPLPQHVRAVSFEHDEDIIPTLGGEPQSISDPGQHGRVVVTRDVYDGHAPTDIGLPGHKMTRYSETSVLVDASHEPALEPAKANLRRLSGTGSTIRYQADRDG